MNANHIAKLLEGVAAWNKWRKEHPNVTPDLAGANLTRADLTRADLIGANLTGAYLDGADLTWANLTKANLAGASLDYSCWPLWCGSKGVRVDIRLVRQLLAHVCAVKCASPEFARIRKAILPYAKKSHRAGDLGLVKP